MNADLILGIETSCDEAAVRACRATSNRGPRGAQSVPRFLLRQGLRRSWSRRGHGPAPRAAPAPSRARRSRCADARQELAGEDLVSRPRNVKLPAAKCTRKSAALHMCDAGNDLLGG